MTDLITLSDYKEYKTIKSSTKDGETQNLISQISALVENYCNRIFLDYYSTDITEWFDGKTEIVYLKHFPLVSVNHVYTSVNGGATKVELDLVDSSGVGDYFVDYDNETVRTSVAGTKFITTYNTPYRSLEIVYNAGYEEVPLDLKLAVLDLVAYYLDSESKPTKSLLGATLDNPLPYLANSFPPHIRRVLDLYRYSPG